MSFGVVAPGFYVEFLRDFLKLHKYFSFLVSLEENLVSCRVGGEHLATSATGQVSEGSQSSVRRSEK